MAYIIPIFVALLGLGLPVLSERESYCVTKPLVCEVHLDHADCNDYEFSEFCADNSRLIAFTPYTPVRKQLVKLMNTLRNNTAGGVTSGNYSENLPFASRMVYMGWDISLTHLANTTIMQCELFGDECRNTDTYPMAGQNVYFENFYHSINEDNSMTVMKNAFAKWRAQKVLVNKNDVMAFRGNGEDFAQLIVDRNIKMGCAMRASQFFKDNIQYNFLCNFAVAPKIGCPIYTIGNEPRDECLTFAADQFPHLCSVDEDYVSSCPNPLSCDIEANKTCLNGKTHTTCLKYTDKRCLLVDITDTSLAVETLNNARAIKVSNLPNMEWEESLEILAAGYAVSCPTREAECAETPAYSPFIQQINVLPTIPTSYTQALQDSFKVWATTSFLKSFVITEKVKTVLVGCAISKTADSKAAVVCNFGIKV